MITISSPLVNADHPAEARLNTLRIAQAQINPTVGDIKGNMIKIVNYITKARSLQADVVTFPELAISGYPPEDLLLKSRFLEDNEKALQLIVSKCSGITAVIGYAHFDGARIFNSAAVIHDSRVVGVYKKLELPNYGVFDEKRYFTPGDRCMVFELGGTNVCVTICEDIWIPGSGSESCVAANHAQLTINISASPFHAGKYELRKKIIGRFAETTGSTVCFNNLVGGQDELVFDGGSMVVSPEQEIIATANRFTEDLLVTDLSFEASSSQTGTVTCIDEPVILNTFASRPLEVLENRVSRELGSVEEIFEALKLGLKDYCAKNGFRKTVVGLSGGIDSALTAAIACEAIGPANVTGVTMPSRFTSNETLSDAVVLADRLGIKLISSPIEGILKAFMDTLDDALGKGPLGVEYENLQARIRGAILMTLSNRFGWLVLTTGNKSETAVGYCTLYGDMAGGFALIKDVPKTLVYELSHFINERSGRELIPHTTINRAPSAELRPDQKDEDSLPPYSVLDPILKAYVEEDKTPDEIKGYDSDTVRAVGRLVDINEYKRRQAPPGVKITPKAFGRDRRLPITNRYCDTNLGD